MQALFTLDHIESAAAYTVFGNDTVNLAVSTAHAEGTYSLGFDKVNGTDNTIYAGAYRTLEPKDLSKFYSSDFVCWQIYVPDVQDVAYTFVRLGTDALNYNEWRYADTNLSAGRFTLCRSRIGDSYYVGVGMDESAITYMAIGVAFDAETNALANIRMDHVHILAGNLITT